MLIYLTEVICRFIVLREFALTISECTLCDYQYGELGWVETSYLTIIIKIIRMMIIIIILVILMIIS